MEFSIFREQQLKLREWVLVWVGLIHLWRSAGRQSFAGYLGLTLVFVGDGALPGGFYSSGVLGLALGYDSLGI